MGLKITKPTSSSSTNLVDQIQNLRNIGNSHYERLKSLSEQSQAAYKSNQKSHASQLASLSKIEKAKAEEAHSKAAALAFAKNNNHREPSEIDLHDLRVKEAIFYLKEKLERLESARKEKMLVIITGVGNNSAYGVAKIKPAVVEFLTEIGQTNFVVGEPNHGCITLYLEKRGPELCILL